MDSQDSNVAVSSLATQGSHPGIMLGHHSHEPLGAASFVDDDYLVTGQLSNDAYPLWFERPLYFFASDTPAGYSLSCPSYPPTPSESSQTEGIDPKLISGDVTVPSSPGDEGFEECVNFSPRTSPSSDNVPDADPAVEDEEEPFLSPGPSLTLGCHEATCAPPVGGNENSADGDEGEGEIEESSTESLTKSPQVGVTDEDVATNTANDQACPGLKGKDKDEQELELQEYLELAASGAADARAAGSGKVLKVPGTHKCTECDRTNRRYDRLLTHVIHAHLGLKPWVCPLCPRVYTGRNELSGHLSAVRVVCLCGRSFTKNNSYTHARICKVCKDIGGRPKVENGQIIMVQETAPQAGPSVPNPTQESVSEEGPPAPRQRSVSRKPPQKRKRQEFDDYSEGAERKDKRFKRRCA